jgi:hypothetical protein
MSLLTQQIRSEIEEIAKAVELLTDSQFNPLHSGEAALLTAFGSCKSCYCPNGVEYKLLTTVLKLQPMTPVIPLRDDRIVQPVQLDHASHGDQKYDATVIAPMTTNATIKKRKMVRVCWILTKP